MLRLLNLALILALCSLNTASTLAAPDSRSNSNYSLMDPHAPPSEGPWFEGWYTRVVDAQSGRSIAVIVASNVSDGEKITMLKGVRGYAAILVSEGGDSQTQSFEAFPESTTIQAYGSPRLGNTAMSETTDFVWSAEGFGHVTQNEIDIKVGPVSFKAKMTDWKHWDSRSTRWGPGGISAFVPMIPLHWYVFSLGSKTQYELTFENAKPVTGLGYAHQEKNWGAAFPTAWAWMQGIDSDNQAQFALAGGPLDIGPIPVETFLAGYRSPKIQVDFRPTQPGTNYRRSIDACTGTMVIEAANPSYRMLVRAQAPLNTFGPVSIPTPTGYQANGGIESFSATIEIEVHHNGLLSSLSSNTLIERRTFRNAALEFGADWQICNRR